MNPFRSALTLVAAALLVGASAPASATDDVVLSVSLEIDRDVYDETVYGSPPQFAIWLESPDGKKIQTVWVTRRTGKGDWEGALERLTSLPYWVSRYNKETGTKGAPTYAKPIADAVTGPTPKREFRTFFKVPRDSQWKVFIEVNASGDFNRAFPMTLANGTPDPDGNGQPSIVYSGTIEAKPGKTLTPKLIGRTGQFDVSGKLNPDVKEITTAADLLPEIEVKCLEKKPVEKGKE